MQKHEEYAGSKPLPVLHPHLVTKEKTEMSWPWGTENAIYRVDRSKESKPAVCSGNNISGPVTMLMLRTG